MSTRADIPASVDIIGEIDWGAHLCLLYESKEDLLSALGLYFRQGINRDALCLWVPPPILGLDAAEAIRDFLPRFDLYCQNGQIRVIPYSEWYLSDGAFDASAVAKNASSLLHEAMMLGHRGIWVAGDLGWLMPRDWQLLVSYEESVTRSISNGRVAALCTYPLTGLGALEAVDLFRTHRIIISKRQGRWHPAQSLEQIKTEEALRELEVNYKQLFDTTLDGIEVIDGTTGRILLANQAAARIFGFDSPEEMVGLDPLDYIPADDRERVAQLMAESMFEKDLHQIMELRALRKDGSEVWVSAIGVRTQFQGKLAGIVSIRDITEHRKVERALLESQRTLQAVFNGVREGIALFDLDGKLLSVNRRILEVGGYTEDEITGKSFDQLHMVSPESIAKIPSLLPILRSGEGVPPLEMELVTKSGQRLVLDVRITPLKKEDNVIGSIVVMRDITERKLAEESLRKSEARYRLLAENVSDVIWITDADLKPIYISPSIERLTGLTPEESMSRRISNGLTPSSIDVVLSRLKTLTSPSGEKREGVETIEPTDLELQRKDGSTVWVATTVSVIRDADGRPSQFMGVLRDITARKRAEEEIQRSYERLERVLEGTIQAIRAMVDTRDRYTAGHQQRVTELSCAIARAMHLSNQQVQAIHIAGLLHDVGKILIPTEILAKPGRLDEIELAMIRTHPRASYDILKSIEFPWPVARMVLQHHERMDGSGYPDGLRGDDILLEARILAVADVVEAMASHRPYRPALSLDKALEEISQNSGVLYDAQVVEACLHVFRVENFKFETEAVL